jgi:hypothetical protein
VLLLNECFVVVSFVIDSVRKLLDTHSCVYTTERIDYSVSVHHKALQYVWQFCQPQQINSNHLCREDECRKSSPLRPLNDNSDSVASLNVLRKMFVKFKFWIKILEFSTPYRIYFWFDHVIYFSREIGKLI